MAVFSIRAKQYLHLICTGAVTTENGYAEAPGYNQGRVEMVVGGGVCQVTTDTL